MKRNIHVALLLSGVALGGTFALTRSSLAAPYFERYSSASCAPNYPQAGSHGFPIGDFAASELQHNSNGVLFVTCPVVSKTDLPPSSITNIDVYVRDGNDNGTTQSTAYQLFVRACSATEGSAACGAEKWSSGSTYQTLSLDGALINKLATYNQPYLMIALPAQDAASSAIVGMTYSHW